MLNVTNRSTTELKTAADALVGRRVNTTSNEEGVVTFAKVSKRVIQFTAEADDGTVFYSDLEHATVSRELE